MTHFMLGFFTMITTLFQQPPQQPLEVKFQPDSVLYVYETFGVGSSRKLYTGLIQNTAFINRSHETIILEAGTIRSLKGGIEIQSKAIRKKDIQSSASVFNSLQKAGVLGLYDFQFQTKQYLPGVSFSASDTLKPGEAVVVTHEAILFDELPDEVIISIKGRTLKKKEVTSGNTLKVVNHHSKNKYIFPLKGRWVAAAAPSLISHHRWAAIQEFAYDFVKVGNDVSTYGSDGTKLTDYYSYGKNIYAIGDGKIVSALDSIQETDDGLKRAGEKEEEYLQRVMAHQQELLKKGFKYIMGNHIIIQHENGEYSFYLHLKKGSLHVKQGDVIKQGAQIAELGNSGNSTEPHLHFHVANGPDIAHSRSLPIRFSNIHLYPDDNGQITHLHAGQMVIADEVNH